MPWIKAIYQAENADQALVRLEEFEAEWGKRYPAIGAAWRGAWEHAIPFFAFAPSIRKMIYTTNAVEALNRSLRKACPRLERGSSKQEEASQRTRRRLSSCIWPSKMRACIGEGPSNGRLPWGSSPSSSATALLLQRAEEAKRKGNNTGRKPLTQSF